jgi:hypothetical protein
MDEYSQVIEIFEFGEDVEEECSIDPTDYIDLIQHRLRAAKVTVTMSGKSLYDLAPGTWIDLTVDSGHDPQIRTIAASTETLNLSDIANHLPALFVQSVEVSHSGDEQITSVEAIGWLENS